MRAILDASVIIAAVVTKNPRSASRLVIEAVALGAFDLVVTNEIEAEYRDVVDRDKVKRLAPRFDRASFVDAIVGTAERVEAAGGVRHVKQDPKDDKYVAAALAGRAEYVVSFDRRHLLALGKYEGVSFVTPGDFLAVLRSSTS